jgi:hypothetical protein
MPTLTFTYKGLCAGGEHATLGVNINGTERRQMVFQKQEMLTPGRMGEGEITAFITTLLKMHRHLWVRKNPSGTNAQYITALQAAEWDF